MIWNQQDCNELIVQWISTSDLANVTPRNDTKILHIPGGGQRTLSPDLALWDLWPGLVDIYGRNRVASESEGWVLAESLPWSGCPMR